MRITSLSLAIAAAIKFCHGRTQDDWIDSTVVITTTITNTHLVCPCIGHLTASPLSFSTSYSSPWDGHQWHTSLGYTTTTQETAYDWQDWSKTGVQSVPTLSWTPQSTSPQISISTRSSTTRSGHYSRGSSTQNISASAPWTTTSIPYLTSSTSLPPTTRGPGTTRSQSTGTSVSVTSSTSFTSTTSSSTTFTSSTTLSSATSSSASISTSSTSSVTTTVATTTSTTTTSTIPTTTPSPSSTSTTTTPSITTITTTTTTTSTTTTTTPATTTPTTTSASACPTNACPSAITTDVITDGSFEDVSSNTIGVLDTSSGDWAVSGNAFFDQNSGTPYDTPDGSKFVYFRGTSATPTSSVSQNLTNLIPNTFYTLTYDYAYPSVDNPNNGGGFSFCGLTLQVGDNSFPDLLTVSGTDAQTAWGQSGGLDFLVDCSDLVFSLIWDCSQLLPGNEIDLVIDNVGFTGGQCVEEPV